MKAVRFGAILVIAGVLGIVLGFAVRTRLRGNSPLVANSIVAWAESASANSASGKTQNGIRGKDSPLASASKLEHDLSMSKGVTRWLYWMQAIEQASLSDMPRLARLAKNDPAALRLVASRWIDLNPKDFFYALLKPENQDLPTGVLGWILMNEWFKRDPNGVIQELDEGPALSARQEWRMTIAESAIEKDPELGLKLMARWHITHLAPSTVAVAKWAESDPRHAAEVTLANSAATASREVMLAIGEQWGKSDPEAALDFAAQQKGTLGSVLASAALKSWAGRDLSQAAEWLAQADASTRNHLSPAFVEEWAGHDAASALTWCEENLAGISLTDAVSGVLKGTAEKDVHAAARLVDVMQPSSARTAGAIAVAEKWLPYNNKPIDSEAIKWLGSLDPESQRGVLQTVYQRVAESDPQQIASFLSRSTVDHISPSVYTEVAANLARKSPAQAIEWANTLPDAVQIEAGSNAFAQWRKGQPDAAMNWLHALPETDPRRAAFFKSMIQEIAWDQQGPAQLAAMPAQDRAAARAIIEKIGLAKDRQAAFRAALTGVSE